MKIKITFVSKCRVGPRPGYVVFEAISWLRHGTKSKLESNLMKGAKLGLKYSLSLQSMICDVIKYTMS